MLHVEKLQAAYGQSQVLFDVSLHVGEREVVTLLGRNGMGKTTTIRAVMGLTPPRGGEVKVGGASVAGWAPERIARSASGSCRKVGRSSPRSPCRRTWSPPPPIG